MMDPVNGLARSRLEYVGRLWSWSAAWIQLDPLVWILHLISGGAADTY